MFAVRLKFGGTDGRDSTVHFTGILTVSLKSGFWTPDLDTGRAISYPALECSDTQRTSLLFFGATAAILIHNLSPRIHGGR